MNAISLVQSDHPSGNARPGAYGHQACRDPINGGWRCLRQKAAAAVLLLLGASASVDAMGLATADSSNISASCTFSYMADEDADNRTLQRVRGRIVDTDKSHRQRSECGRNAADAVNNFRACAKCQRELTNLLKDAAQVQRNAANAFRRDPASRKVFLDREIEVRLILNDYLSGSLADPDPSHGDRRLNLAALADAYQHIKRGRELHEVAVAQSALGTLGETSFGIWAQAVRSCDTWDFVSGGNRMSRQALFDALCSQTCVGEYQKLDSAVDATANPRIRAMVSSFVPSKLCAPQLPPTTTLKP